VLLSRIVTLCHVSQERTHLKAHLDTDWITETETIFRQHVVEDDRVRPHLFAHLRDAGHADPVTLDPAAMLCLAQRLYRLNPHYTSMAPQWFQQYIPPGWSYTDPECVTELTTLPTVGDWLVMQRTCTRLCLLCLLCLVLIVCCC